jgi:hypothetical protein
VDSVSDDAVSEGTRGPREWPFLVVLAGLVVAIAVVVLGSFRLGSVLLGAVVILAAFLRLLLREDEAGLLAVRTKIVDVVTLGVLGIGLGVLAFAVPPTI